MAEQIPALTQERIYKALRTAGEMPVAAAFKKLIFIYGTAGKGSLIVKGLKNWAKRPHSKAVDPADRLKPVIDRELALFDPGRRAEQYLAGDYQMMDLYYGQEGTSLHLKRDPKIAEFVHYAMGFKEPFAMSESGRHAYMRTWKTSEEGWKANSPGDYGQTATKEISRLIRYGIRTFGGTLIFEGREVYYSQVFLRSAPRVGDTDLEARELFPYCTKGLSSFSYGKGRLEFQWAGKETVPTRLHFLTNWSWGGPGVMHATKNLADPKAFSVADFFDFWYNFQRVPNALRGLGDPALEKYLRLNGFPPLSAFGRPSDPD